MPAWSASSIFARAHKRKLLAACAACALLFFLAACMLAAKAIAPGNSSGLPADPATPARTVLNCVFGVLISFWGVTAYLRCLDPRISRRLAAIAVLAVLWLLAVTIKWNTSYDNLERYLWYSYYIPMACIPLLCVSCAALSASVKLDRRRRCARSSCIACSVAFAALALTNDAHQLFFTFETPTPGIVGHYAYGPAYWAFFAYSTLIYLTFFAVLWRSSRSALRALVVPAATLACGGVLYCAAYALRVEWAASLNFSLVYCILVVVTLELCLDLGLIPSTRSFKRVFADLPLDLKIISHGGQVFSRTQAAGAANQDALDHALASAPASFTLPNAPDGFFVAWPLSGGVALLAQDKSAVRKLTRTLKDKSAKLEQERKTLEHEHEVAELLAELEAESRLIDSIDAALSKSMGEVCNLLRHLPQESLARRHQLERARMLVAYSKRKGSLALAAVADPKLDGGRISLIVNEMACDMRAVGIDCAAVVSLDEPVATQLISVLYDCIYDIAYIAFECRRPALMYHLCKKDDALELRAHLQSDDKGDLSLNARTRQLRESLDRSGIAYRLEGDTGCLLLVASAKEALR